MKEFETKATFDVPLEVSERAVEESVAVDTSRVAAGPPLHASQHFVSLPPENSPSPVSFIPKLLFVDEGTRGK